MAESARAAALTCRKCPNHLSMNCWSGFPKMPNNDAKRLIRKVALAHFKDKKMLLVRDSKNDTVFIMPGGKVEEGETDIECLNREVKEELGIKLEPSSIKFLQEFNGPAHGHGDDVLLNIKIYQAEMI